MSLRDEILAANDLGREPIELPEWTSAKLFVRVMPGEERDAFEASTVKRRGKNVEQNLSNLRARLAVRVLVDEGGNRIFKDEDADALGMKSGAALEKVFSVACRLNRLRNEDVEELVGNS